MSTDPLDLHQDEPTPKTAVWLKLAKQDHEQRTNAKGKS